MKNRRIDDHIKNLMKREALRTMTLSLYDNYLEEISEDERLEEMLLWLKRQLKKIAIVEVFVQKKVKKVNIEWTKIEDNTLKAEISFKLK